MKRIVRDPDKVLPPLPELLASMKNVKLPPNIANRVVDASYTPPPPPPPQSTSNLDDSSEDLPQFPSATDDIKNLIPMFGVLQNVILQKMKEYDALAEQYQKVNALYMQKLNDILPAIALAMGKAPLSQLTDPDLPEKLGQVMEFTSYTDGLQAIPKIVKGYYIAKANGLDTTQLNPDELIAISENPVLAQSYPDQIAKMLDVYATQIQMQLATATKQFGFYKQILDSQQKYLNTYAESIKGIMNAIISGDRLDALNMYREMALNLRQEELNINETYKNILATISGANYAEKVRHDKAEEKNSKDKVKLESDKFNWKKTHPTQKSQGGFMPQFPSTMFKPQP